MQFRDTLKVKYHGIYFKVLQKKKKKERRERKYGKILAIHNLGEVYTNLYFSYNSTFS